MDTEEDKIIIELTSQNFEDAISSATTPVLVDFYTPWCGPCKMIAPVLEELAKELEGKVKFGKVNADEEIEIANKYSVRMFPTMLVFKDGEVVQTIIGLTSKPDLASRLASL